MIQITSYMYTLYSSTCWLTPSSCPLNSRSTDFWSDSTLRESANSFFVFTNNCFSLLPLSSAWDLFSSTASVEFRLNHLKKKKNTCKNIFQSTLSQSTFFLKMINHYNQVSCTVYDFFILVLQVNYLQTYHGVLLSCMWCHGIWFSAPVLQVLFLMKDNLPPFLYSAKVQVDTSFIEEVSSYRLMSCP